MKIVMPGEFLDGMEKMADEFEETVRRGQASRGVTMNPPHKQPEGKGNVMKRTTMETLSLLLLVIGSVEGAVSLYLHGLSHWGNMGVYGYMTLLSSATLATLARRLS